MCICIMLAGCGTAAAKREVHSLDGWKVVYNDPDAMYKACRGLHADTRGINITVGCTDYANKTIYCPKWNFSVCGHELHHITDGPFHEE